MPTGRTCSKHAIDGRESIAGIQRLRRYPLYVTYAIDLASVRRELWEHLAVFGLVAIVCSAILLAASLGAVRIANNEQRALRGWQAETEQRQRMEAQMRQAFKMEALGRMAGGIAHHFNNLLPAMSGLLEQTLSEVPRDSATAGRVERMIDAVAQGRRLVRQILVFSRREIPGRERLSMAAIIEDALALVQGKSPAQHHASRRTADRMAMSLAIRAQLQEAVLNLLSNAVQAVGARSGGRIVLSVEDRSLDEQQALRLSLPRGDYTCACLPRQWHGHAGRGRRARLRPVLHDKTGRRGHRTRTGDHAWDRREPQGRRLHGKQARRRNHGFDLFAESRADRQRGATAGSRGIAPE